MKVHLSDAENVRKILEPMYKRCDGAYETALGPFGQLSQSAQEKIGQAFPLQGDEGFLFAACREHRPVLVISNRRIGMEKNGALVEKPIETLSAAQGKPLAAEDNNYDHPDLRFLELGFSDGETITVDLGDRQRLNGFLQVLSYISSQNKSK
ncbi:MAG TPA: hypothetical protein PKV71_08895 [Calditrichia bacterium]|nr:hypothetical protein [Calditrichota bacterium]HQU72812.1 hypothetical protein [Calditrichia bacterium]HQV31980.1 hypothetical protein [Calditrichia bacterium]